MPTAQRRLEYLPLPEVQRAPRNPNGHDLPALAASIRRHGFVEPVVVDERTGYLVGGHGRLDVLADMQAAGDEPPDGVVADGDRWLLPVILGWASRSDAEAEALLVAMMRLPKQPVAAPDLLHAMLDELAQQPAGLEGTGYTADDLDDLLASIGVPELPDQGTDAAHAHLPERAEAAAPREVQGLREVGLMFTAEQHREYLEYLAKMKRLWGQDAAPLVVLRALREASERL